MQPKPLFGTDQYSLTNMANDINIFLLVLLLVPNSSSKEQDVVKLMNEVKELRVLFQEIQASVSQFQVLQVSSYQTIRANHSLELIKSHCTPSL